MSNPRDPSHDGADDIERRLRDSLERNAMHAPNSDLVAERIIHAAGRPADGSRHRHWWAAPLAAAAVLAVVAGVVLAVTQLGSPSSKPDRAADSSGVSVSRSPSSPSPTSTPDRSERPSTSSANPNTNATRPVGPATLHDIRLTDLTFDSLDSGWALGSADCLDGSGSRCTALLHTSNGSDWQARPGAQFNVPGVNGCASPCVDQIRFADDRIGYAFGPSAFFMTTDGGVHWVQQSGGALALETLDGNAVRVVSKGDGCPGPCDVQVQTSDNGSPTWTTRGLGRSSGSPTYDVSLARGGSDVYLLFTGHVAGGGDSATSTLYRSGNDGQTWRASGEPCPQSGGEVDSHAISASADGRVTALCGTRQAPMRWSVATSTDHGATFHTQPGRVPARTAGSLAGDASAVLLTGSDGIARSTDGGHTWATVPQVQGTVTFVGLESDSVGRVVTDGGRTIWTTRNAGKTWTRVGLG